MAELSTFQLSEIKHDLERDSRSEVPEIRIAAMNGLLLLHSLEQLEKVLSLLQDQSDSLLNIENKLK